MSNSTIWMTNSYESTCVCKNMSTQMQFQVNKSLCHTFSYNLARILAHSCTHIYTTHSYGWLIHTDESFLWMNHSCGWLIHIKVQCVQKYKQDCMKMCARVTHSDESACVCSSMSRSFEKKWGSCRCIEFVTHVCSLWVMYSSWQ